MLRTIFQSTKTMRNTKHLPRYTPNLELLKNSYSKSVSSEDDDLDKPIKYSTSEASTWLAEHSRRPKNEHEKPMSHIVIIYIGILSFLIYFGILREENDLDKLLDRDLSEIIEGIVPPAKVHRGQQEYQFQRMQLERQANLIPKD